MWGVSGSEVHQQMASEEALLLPFTNFVNKPDDKERSAFRYSFGYQNPAHGHLHGFLLYVFYVFFE